MQRKVSRVLGATFVAVGLSTFGCQDPGESTQSVAAEANDLGIAEVEIIHGFQFGDPIVTITGLDEAGRTIATATVRTGTVFYSSDPNMTSTAGSRGRELTISIGELRTSTVNPGLDALQLSSLLPVQADRFVHIRVVADALASEKFVATTATNETAFSTPTTCPGSWFPTMTPSGSGSSTSCCRDDASGSVSFHKIANGSNANKIAQRIYAQACRTAGGNTGCTTDCFYGPCGGGTFALYDNGNPNGTGVGDANSKVFHPNSDATQCGYDPDGAKNKSPAYSPESYNFSQSEWTGVTATCPYSGCNSDGTPYAVGAGCCNGLCGDDVVPC